MSDINEMNVGPRWYVAHTYSGYENKVKTSLEKIVENRGLENLIYDIKIPVQIIIEKKGDQEIEVEEKLFPGYVYIKMAMNDESWHAVRGITGVTGFVGPGSRPSPLSDEEVAALNIEEKKVKLSYNVGDIVFRGRVCSLQNRGLVLLLGRSLLLAFVIPNCLMQGGDDT